jgi:hypothetical protein
MAPSCLPTCAMHALRGAMIASRMYVAWQLKSASGLGASNVLWEVAPE